MKSEDERNETLSAERKTGLRGPRDVGDESFRPAIHARATDGVRVRAQGIRVGTNARDVVVKGQYQ